VHLHRIAGIGGSERHLLTLLPALAERGADVSFAGLDVPGKGAEPFYAELAAAGVPYERLACPRDLDPRLAHRLRTVLRGRLPDVVHTHLVHADIYGALARPGRLVSTRHNPDPFRTGPFQFVERAFTRRTDRVVAISEAVRDFCVRRVGLPPGKVVVIRYGLDGLPPPWGENPPLPLEGRRVLLCVARLSPQKGVDTAIRALPRIRRDHADAVLLVLGEGPERQRLETLAGELGVSGSVLMPGRVGDVAALYRRADVVVHPARWEGFGLALLEAMLAGKPVVATRAGSAPEVVGEESGTLVPPDDAQALGEAVSSLLSDPARAAALGAAALARAEAEFSVARMAERTGALYADLLSRTRL
jgi:glycosyltransferase involved in cell wall biosynthesis